MFDKRDKRFIVGVKGGVFLVFNVFNNEVFYYKKVWLFLNNFLLWMESGWNSNRGFFCVEMFFGLRLEVVDKERLMVFRGLDILFRYFFVSLFGVVGWYVGFFRGSLFFFGWSVKFIGVLGFVCVELIGFIYLEGF